MYSEIMKKTSNCNMAPAKESRKGKISDTGISSQQSYKFAGVNMGKLNVFCQSDTEKQVMQRILAKEEGKGKDKKTIIKCTGAFLNKFDELVKEMVEEKEKLNPPKTVGMSQKKQQEYEQARKREKEEKIGVLKEKLRHNYEQVVINALLKEGTTGKIEFYWSAAVPETPVENTLLDDDKILYYYEYPGAEATPILLPLLEDLVDEWYEKLYSSSSGCVGDSLEVIKAARNGKMDEPLKQSDVETNYNNTKMPDGTKIEPYFTGGSDILYRLNNLKLVYQFDKSKGINEREKLSDPLLNGFFTEGSRCIVSVTEINHGREGMGHNIAVIDGMVYDMQHNPDWKNPAKNGVEVKPNECQRERTEFNNYFVEYIYMDNN